MSHLATTSYAQQPNACAPFALAMVIAV